MDYNFSALVKFGTVETRVSDCTGTRGPQCQAAVGEHRQTFKYKREPLYYAVAVVFTMIYKKGYGREKVDYGNAELLKSHSSLGKPKWQVYFTLGFRY